MRESERVLSIYITFNNLWIKQRLPQTKHVLMQNCSMWKQFPPLDIILPLKKPWVISAEKKLSAASFLCMSNFDSSSSMVRGVERNASSKMIKKMIVYTSKHRNDLDSSGRLIVGFWPTPSITLALSVSRSREFNCLFACTRLTLRWPSDVSITRRFGILRIPDHKKTTYETHKTHETEQKSKKKSFFWWPFLFRPPSRIAIESRNLLTLILYFCIQMRMTWLTFPLPALGDIVIAPRRSSDDSYARDNSHSRFHGGWPLT